MAKSKNKSKTNTKKTTKPTTARRKAAPPRLDAAARASMLKPGDSLNELIADVLTAWAQVRRKVRLPDVTPAKLASLDRKAVKASKRESDLAAKQAARLAPLTDARIASNDLAYRAALKVKRIADAIGTTDPAVAHAFATVTSRFRPGVKTAPAQTKPAAPTST